MAAIGARMVLRHIGGFDELDEIDDNGGLGESVEIVPMHKFQPQPLDPVRDSMPPANVDALATAYARAEESKVELLKRADMLNGEQLAAELGLSRATVDTRRQEGKLLALEFGSKRGFRFPQWQRDLVEERDIRESFEAVLNRLAPVGPWSRYRFFVQNSPELGGRTPIEALRAGEGEAVLHAAESWVAGEQGGG
jgi:biotin operon repressor